MSKLTKTAIRGVGDFGGIDERDLGRLCRSAPPTINLPTKTVAYSSKGRVTDYTAELGGTICDAIAEGHSLTSILKNDGMPSMGTVMRWLQKFKEFRELYIAARNFQQETLCDELRDIADNENANEPWRAFLRVSTRKFLIGRLRSKKYGDYATCDWLTGADEPLRIEVITGVPDDGDGL
jgi:hypothetical protein